MEASLELLIQQWSNQPNLRALIQIWLDIYKREIDGSYDRLEQMRDIDLSEGVWLDYIAERLGIRRPSIDSTTTFTTTVQSFGFATSDGAQASGVGFDQAPFEYRVNESLTSLDNRVLLGDASFRRMVKARGWYVRSLGNMRFLLAAAIEVDDGVQIVDNRDMTITITTSNKALMDLSIQFQCLPISAGLEVTTDDGTDHPIPAGLTLSQTAFTLFESRSAQYYVQLASPPAFDEIVTVTITSADDDKVSVDGGPFDFSRNDWSVRQGPVTVTAETDMDADAESVNIVHTITNEINASQRYGSVMPVNLPVSVIDVAIAADEQIVSFEAFNSITELPEGSLSRVDLTADITSDSDTDVWFNITMEGMFAPDDQIGYRSVTIAEGSQSQSLTVQTTDDAVVESNGSITMEIVETDTLTLNVAGLRSAFNSMAVGEVLTVTDGSNSVTTAVLETGRVGNVSTLRLSHADWSDLSGTLTISSSERAYGSAWEASPESTVGDVNVAGEWHLEQRSQDYAFNPDNTSVEFTITDNDEVINPEMSINRISAASVVEGTNVQFRFAADEAPNLAKTIKYRVAQTGNFLNAADLGDKQFVLASGFNVQDIVIRTIDDDMDETDGTVTITLLAGDGYTISTTAGSASTAITDDDIPPADPPSVAQEVIYISGSRLSLSNGDQQADIQWSPPTSNGGAPLTGYVIQIGTNTEVAGRTEITRWNNQSFEVGPNVRRTTLTWTDNPMHQVEPGNTGQSLVYFYARVAAKNEAGTGPFSEWEFLFVQLRSS